MYERRLGTKYQGYMGASEVAKLVRADIAEAKAAGKLPKALKVYVTSESYSMGQSVNVRIGYDEKFWMVCEGIVPGSKQYFDDGVGYTALNCGNVWCAANNDSPNAEVHEVLTIEGRRIKGIVEAIHAAYNHDGSDLMTDYFDVMYYGIVEVEDKRSHEWRAKETARKAEARKNAAAKKELIDHLFEEHAGKLPFGIKRGRMRNYSFERLTELHEKFHAA